MTFVLGGLVLAVLLALLIGALTGRVRLSSCCAPADPSKDLRMRQAFGPDHGTDPEHKSDIHKQAGRDGGGHEHFRAGP